MVVLFIIFPTDDRYHGHSKGNNMILVTYKIYSKYLNKSFTNSKLVNTKKDFDYFNLALHSGKAEILKIKKTS